MSADLEIVSEDVMAEIPRGRDGHEMLRVTFTRGRTGDGKDAAWHSIRVFWRDDAGQWRPGKQGVTIRGRELAAVAIALLRAVASSVPRELHGAAKQIVTALESAHPQQPARSTMTAPTSSRRRPQEMRPVAPPPPRTDGVDDAEIF